MPHSDDLPVPVPHPADSSSSSAAAEESSLEEIYVSRDNEKDIPHLIGQGELNDLIRLAYQRKIGNFNFSTEKMESFGQRCTSYVSTETQQRLGHLLRNQRMYDLL